MNTILTLALHILLLGVGCSRSSRPIPQSWVRHVATNQNFSVWTPRDWRREHPMHAMGDIDLQSEYDLGSKSGDRIRLTISTGRPHVWKTVEECVSVAREMHTSKQPGYSFANVNEIGGLHPSGSPWTRFDYLCTEPHGTKWNTLAFVDGGGTNFLIVIGFAPANVDQAGKELVFQIMDSLRFGEGKDIR